MKRVLSIAVLLSVSMVSAAVGAQNYERLEGLFLAGKFDAVVSGSKDLISSGYGSKEDIYYLKGLSELKLGRFADARASFDYIITKYPGSRRVFDARIGIGDSYMLGGELNSAVGIYQRILEDFRSDKNLPIVYSRLASCYAGLGVRDKAEYYRGLAARAAPMSFEAKGQTMSAQARAAAPKNQPVTNIAPNRSPQEMDVILVADKALSVQVGSFRSRANAEKLARKLASEGFEARVEIPVAEHDQLYRVKVGRVSTRAEAEGLQARLVNAGYPTKICDGETCR